MRGGVLTTAGLVALIGCGAGDVGAPPGTSAGPGSEATSGSTGPDGEGDSSGSEGATSGSEFAPGPRLVWWTPVTTPDSSVFVRLDADISGAELRVGGRPLPAAPIVYGSDQDEVFGGLFALPPGLAVGTTTLTVRPRGGEADSDRGELEIAAPMFVDVADATGLTNLHDVTDHPTNCAWSQTGVAFADVDGDGDSDAYIGNVGAPGRLLRNDGDTSGDGLPEFTDVTPAFGLAVEDVSSASFMDHDNDGDHDLFIGRRGANVLLQNRLVEDGAPGFVDVTAVAGVGGGDQRTMGVAWGDYDGDGDLDLYVVNHAWCFPVKNGLGDKQDHLYRNDGGVFTEVTDLLGTAAGSPVHSLGFAAAWVDVERDGDVDLVVINDDVLEHGGPNALWRNDGPVDGGWRFVEAGAPSGLAIPADGKSEGANGMGLAVGDVDFDGYPDLAFTNIGPNYLLRNRGDGTFEDVARTTGAARGALQWKGATITWGVHLFDADNDADLDVYYAGGDIHGDAPIPSALLRNDGGVFADATWEAGLVDLGHAKGSALVDLDRDGWLDFATAHWARPLRVFRNQRVGSAGHWLVVDLVGTTSNRPAIGAVVEVEASGLPRQTCFRTGNPSLGAGGELACHFGLGAVTDVARVTITWPDGSVSTPAPPPVDTRVTYTQ